MFTHVSSSGAGSKPKSHMGAEMTSRGCTTVALLSHMARERPASSSPAARASLYGELGGARGCSGATAEFPRVPTAAPQVALSLRTRDLRNCRRAGPRASFLCPGREPCSRPQAMAMSGLSPVAPAPAKVTSGLRQQTGAQLRSQFPQDARAPPELRLQVPLRHDTNPTVAFVHSLLGHQPRTKRRQRTSRKMK